MKHIKVFSTSLSLSLFIFIITIHNTANAYSNNNSYNNNSYYYYKATYDRIKNELQKINNQYPNNAQIISLGKNDSSQDILGIKIFSNKNLQQIERQNSIKGRQELPIAINHLAVGVHHGNEADSADVLLVFANKVLKIITDANDPLNSKYKNYIFHIFPVLNISGFNINSRYEKNASGVSIDPNRDYPDPCFNNSSFRLKSTANLANYIEKNNIIGAVTTHGYIGTFTFPWGTYAKNTHSDDYDFFLNITTESVIFNNYQVGTHTDVIYSAVGAFEDWAYHKHGIWTTLLELERSANLADDSATLVKYFSLLPSERSKNHQHGECNTNISEDEYFTSRP